VGKQVDLFVTQIDADDRRPTRKVRPSKGWKRTVKALLALNRARHAAAEDDPDDDDTDDQPLTDFNSLTTRRPPMDGSGNHVLNSRAKKPKRSAEQVEDRFLVAQPLVNRDDDPVGDQDRDDFDWDDRPRNAKTRNVSDAEDRVLVPTPLIDPTAKTPAKRRSDGPAKRRRLG
jgi:hypothetical protein